VLERFATYGSLALTYGALLLAAFRLNREPRPWVIRFRVWLKGATLFQRAACQAAAIAVGYAVWGVVVVGLSRVHLLAPELASRTISRPSHWVLLAISGGASALIFSMLSDRPPRDEPQDWLLWDKEAINHSETASK